MNQTCYMCDQPATSDEHVPPKCLFPEEKDLPKGVSLREDLIKVPACDIHNMARSKDDEYLLYVLSMNIVNNAVAFRQFSTKVLRASDRRPGLMQSILSGHQEVVAVDEAGTAHNSLMVKADMARIHKCFNQIARALYYKDFQKKFVGTCRLLHDFTIADDSKFTLKVRDGESEQNALEYVKSYFEKSDHKGSNPSVFRYRVEDPDERGLVALSMQFYGGSNAFVAFVPSAYQTT
jgi:hypothetical protein